MKTPPLEPPQSVTTKEAYRLLGVSRSRFHEWRTAGLISPDWFNGNRPMYLRVDVLALPDRLPRRSKPVAPLLPPEDQALAKERAGKPDFAGVFADHLQRLTPSLGEGEARTRALASTIRAYRRYHECDFNTARVAVLALIEEPKAPETPTSEPEPEGLSSAPAPEPDFRRLYFGRLNPGAGEEGKRRAFEFVVNAYRRFHNCSLEDAKRAVVALLKP